MSISNNILNGVFRGVELYRTTKQIEAFNELKKRFQRSRPFGLEGEQQDLLEKLCIFLQLSLRLYATELIALQAKPLLGREITWKERIALGCALYVLSGLEPCLSGSEKDIQDACRDSGITKVAHFINVHGNKIFWGSMAICSVIKLKNRDFASGGSCLATLGVMTLIDKKLETPMSEKIWKLLSMTPLLFLWHTTHGKIEMTNYMKGFFAGQIVHSVKTSYEMTEV